MGAAAPGDPVLAHGCGRSFTVPPGRSRWTPQQFANGEKMTTHYAFKVRSLKLGRTATDGQGPSTHRPRRARRR